MSDCDPDVEDCCCDCHAGIYYDHDGPCDEQWKRLAWVEYPDGTRRYEPQPIASA